MKKTNIDRIARLAGVSTATVSRVINNYPFVKEETRSRVLEVIKSTNYRVNAVARNLRRKKTHSIGVIVSNVLSPFYSIIAKAVEDVATRNRFSTVLCNGGDNPDKELNYLRVLHENRTDGIILSPTGKNLGYYRFLASSGVPIVFFDRITDDMQYDSVMINNSSASEAAVSLLLDRGHRRIGFISGPLDRTTGSERMAGYRRALETRGIAVDDDLIRIGDFTSESGNQLALDLLERASMDALYVANTDMAGGAFRALKHNKVRVPDDLALVIFDDPDWATMVAPEITAVRQPVYSIGSTAADLLFKRILEAENYLDKEPVRVTLEATLVERESV